jgi:hypothetical protein
MSEHTDATEDRSEDEDALGRELEDDDGADEQPQPWAKALPGNDDD